MQERNGAQPVGRRRLLRRAGTVAAGVAGAGAAAAIAAPAAQAAPGDPVVQGQVNNSGTSGTTLTGGTSSTPALTLGNPNGASLRLEPRSGLLDPGTPNGSLGYDERGVIWLSTPDGQGGTLPEYVHTQGTSNTITPITPTRVVDTRYAWGRQYIMNPGGNLAAGGQLLSNKTIEVDLSALVWYAEGAFLNITVTGPIANGFVQVWPTGISRPNTSNVNYQKSQDLSNYAFTAVGWKPGVTDDAISIFTTQTTHVIIDVAAFVLGYGEVSPDVSTAGAADASAKASGADRREQQARANGPKWQR